MALRRTLWQIGTGDDKRPYDGVMIEHWVALLGSGSAGKWYEGHPAYLSERAIHAFAHTAHAGDLVVARRGLSRALAVGVLGDYDHSEALDDIEGWDLQPETSDKVIDQFADRVLTEEEVRRLARTASRREAARRAVGMPT
jgi:hypothetical protein